MTSMTYGVMPRFREFERAFNCTLLPGYKYKIKLSTTDTNAAIGTILRDGAFTAEELWIGVSQLVEKWKMGYEDAGDLASSILSTLEFEWV